MSDIIGHNEPLQKVQCNYCKHSIFSLEKILCKAFPDGIPKNILIGQFQHVKPYPNQSNDIVFEEK
jgi:hypothetical protein